MLVDLQEVEGISLWDKQCNLVSKGQGHGDMIIIITQIGQAPNSRSRKLVEAIKGVACTMCKSLQDRVIRAGIPIKTKKLKDMSKNRISQSFG